MSRMPGETMKCAEFSKIVHELARSQGLTEAEAAIARTHAESCPACASLLVEAEELAAILKSVSAGSRSLGAPESVESDLMAAFRASKPSMSEGSRRWKPRWRPVLGWATLGAVALLLVFAVSSRIPVRRSTPVASTAVSSASAPVASAGRTVSGPATELRNAALQPTSGFVPVPFSGGFAQGDSGVIVRVRVPRASLAELGYPADEMQGQGMVQADLLVGEDGWPRAVWILPESSQR